MELDPSLAAALVAELQRAHGAHTIIVYGSLARGDATAESDIDVAAYSDLAPATRRDARVWEGRFLDAFVYPSAALAAPADVETTKLLGGRVLIDERGLAGGLLARLAALLEAGPPALAPDDAQMRRVWAHKMLARIGRDNLEAHYREHWLLYQLLEDYFALRGQWYFGPRRALADLATRDPDAHAAFVRALAPGAALGAIAALVDRVCDMFEP